MKELELCSRCCGGWPDSHFRMRLSSSMDQAHWHVTAHNQNQVPLGKLPDGISPPKHYATTFLGKSSSVTGPCRILYKSWSPSPKLGQLCSIIPALEVLRWAPEASVGIDCTTARPLPLPSPASSLLHWCWPQEHSPITLLNANFHLGMFPWKQPHTLFPWPCLHTTAFTLLGSMGLHAAM